MTNTEIGARIKETRELRGMTLDDVATRVGVARSTILRYESGTIQKMKLPVLESIAYALSVNPDWLIGKSENSGFISIPSNLVPMPGLRRVPRLGTIACGEPVLAEQNIEDYDSVPDWVKCDFTLVCKGSSMTGARINDGDIVCIKRQETVASGQIAAVMVEGEYEDEATLKRVRLIPGGYILMPENPDYEPQVYTGEAADKVHIIGLATHYISVVK